MICTAYYDSPLGKLLLAAEDNALVGAWFEDQKYFPYSLKGGEKALEDHPVLTLAAQWLDRYFAGEKPGISELTVNPWGSDFRREVWKILCKIPYGEVITYGETAKMIAAGRGGEKTSARAVGGAVGHNPVSIIIPCHRVIGADGSLTGYAGGIDRKIRLLELEGADTGGLALLKRRAAMPVMKTNVR